jgi:hypothetical protein
VGGEVGGERVVAFERARDVARRIHAYNHSAIRKLGSRAGYDDVLIGRRRRHGGVQQTCERK